MTRRLKRLKDFDLSLEIKNPQLIAPPRESQRNWLLNRALGELAGDLLALDEVARRFVRGADAVRVEERSQSDLEDPEIMEDWQCPIMKAMARLAADGHGDVLEVGFGRGIASGYLQSFGVRSHTVIECNEFIVARFESWRAAIPDRDIRMVHGMWQDVIGALGVFDAVLFHTYPLNEDEQLEYVSGSATFAEHFFATAAAHLKLGGVFTYMSNEIDSLGRGHQRALLRHFREISMSVLELELPDDVKDAWWADSMVSVKAVK